MELELKHLAPYLPYGLRAVDEYGKSKMIDWLHQSYTQSCVGLNHVLKIQVTHANSFIPILRPMSDLTKKFYYNNNEIDMCSDFSGYKSEFKELSELNDCHYTKFIKWQTMELLFEFHFDVFGLIPKGLAVDINTLSVE